MLSLRDCLVFLGLLCVTVSTFLEDAEFLLTSGNYIAGKKIKRSTVLRGVNSNECSTLECKTTTSKMLLAMDHSADACEEFYELACGKYVKENGFTNDNFKTLEYYLNTKVTYSAEKYLQDFKRFYESCIHYSLDFNFLNKLNVSNIPPAANITEVFIEGILTQSMPFFDIGIDIDANDRMYQFVFTLPGVDYLKTTTAGWTVFEESEQECLEILQNSIGVKSVDLDKKYSEYLKCKEDILMLYVQDFEGIMKLTNKTTNNEVFLQQILELCQKFALSQDTKRSIQISKDFKPMTINEIKTKYGIIDWKFFFESITNSKNFVGTEKILVAFPDHLEFIFNELNKIDENTLSKMLQEFTRFQLYRNIVIPRRTDNRELYCMSLAHEIMPDIVSIMLYELTSTKNNLLSNYQAKHMFEDFKNALNNAIKESSLDDKSKTRFEKKLELLNMGLINTGDTNATRDNYKYLKIREDFQENLVNLLKNYRKFIYEQVGYKSTSASLLNFFVSPFSTRPKAFYTSDSIVLHPEIFKTVSKGLPGHMRLAKLGFFLAQSITQHFDPSGRLYMTNNLRSNDAYYEDLIKSTNEVFDTYYMKIPITFHKSFLKLKPISGELFVNEIISDNAAFKLVTDYLQTIKRPKDLPWIKNGTISFNQSFFIAFAQEFCDDQSEASFVQDLIIRRNLPPQIRLKNIISNSILFAETFNCVEGSSYWLDPSVIRQFPYDPVDDYDNQGQYT